MNKIGIPVNILKEFMELYSLSIAEAKVIEKMFCEFVDLHEGTTKGFCMLSDDVDSLWHFLILFYPNYLNVFTKIRVGRLIIHKENDEKSDGKDDFKKISETGKRYQEKGFKLPTNVFKTRPIDLNMSKRDEVKFKQIDFTKLKPKKAVNKKGIEIEIDDGVEFFKDWGSIDKPKEFLCRSVQETDSMHQASNCYSITHSGSNTASSTSSSNTSSSHSNSSSGSKVSNSCTSGSSCSSSSSSSSSCSSSSCSS